MQQTLNRERLDKVGIEKENQTMEIQQMERDSMVLDGRNLKGQKVTIFLIDIAIFNAIMNQYFLLKCFRNIQDKWNF